MKLNPYLFFNGNCAAAFKYYEKCLGGKIATMLTHAETPAGEQVPPEWREKIIHARMTVAGTQLMASDAPPGRQAEMGGFSVSLIVDTPADASRIFNALAANGTVRMPLEKTFFAASFGMIVDQFGVPWMINCEAQQ